VSLLGFYRGLLGLGVMAREGPAQLRVLLARERLRARLRHAQHVVVGVVLRRLVAVTVAVPSPAV
jgi:hypothetical protein